MQFLPLTFAAFAYPVPPAGADPPSPYDPVDAVHAAARYLCATGARGGRDIPAAVFAYNRDPAYVRDVLATAEGYAAAAAPADAWARSPAQQQTRFCGQVRRRRARRRTTRSRSVPDRWVRRAGRPAVRPEARRRAAQIRGGGP